MSPAMTGQPRFVWLILAQSVAQAGVITAGHQTANELQKLKCMCIIIYTTMVASELNKNWDVPLVWYEGETIFFPHCFQTRCLKGKGASFSVGAGLGNGKILACCSALVLSASSHHSPFHHLCSLYLFYFHW